MRIITPEKQRVMEAVKRVNENTREGKCNADKLTKQRENYYMNRE